MYVKNGKWNYSFYSSDLTNGGLKQLNGVNYYFTHGLLDTSISGLTLHSNLCYYYLEKGVLIRDDRIVTENGKEYYVHYGKWQSDRSGFYSVNGSYYKILNGYTDTEFTDLKKISGVWYAFENGKQAENPMLITYSGNNKIYYAENGIVDLTYSSLTKLSGTWYDIVNGKLAVDYTGLVAYNNSQYYVVNGVLDWSVNGIQPLPDGSFAYIVKAKLKAVCGLYDEITEIGTDENGEVLYEIRHYYFVDGYCNNQHDGIVDIDGVSYQVTDGIAVEIDSSTDTDTGELQDAEEDDSDSEDTEKNPQQGTESNEG